LLYSVEVMGSQHLFTFQTTMPFLNRVNNCLVKNLL